MASQGTIWTIGHSTRSIDAFIAILGAHGIEAVVDVRRFPGSRRLPQFGSESLAKTLDGAGIAYRWIEALGGRRRATAATPATAWRNAAFDAYAAHVESPEFAQGLAELLDISGGMRTVIMCAEVLWWRCHRRIISDVLVSLGYEVLHIADERPASVHAIQEPGRLVDGRLTYAPDQLPLL